MPNSTAKASRSPGAQWSGCCAPRAWPAHGAEASSHDRSPGPRRGRRIWSGAGSTRRPRTSSGSRTSPTCRPGRGWSTSRSSLMPTRAGSWAGEPRPACAPAWSSTPSNRPSGPAAGRARQDLSGLIAPLRRRVPIRLDRLHRTARRRRGRAVGRVGRRRLRQRAGRVDDRAVQDRADQAARTVAHRRAGRDRHPRIRRLVQPPPAAQRRRRPATRRTRDTRTTVNASANPSRSTQPDSSPDTPGRFRVVDTDYDAGQSRKSST